MPSNSQPLNLKRIERLFLCFSAFYGQLWRSQFKSEEFLKFMKQEWFEALKNIEDKFVNEAINSCRLHKEFPPTLPQFMSLCMEAKKRTVFHQEEAYKKAHPEVVKQYLAKMKELLK
jgi:hypothetical protein